MSDLKISELTPQTSATTGDLLVAVRGSTNYHMTWDNFKTSLAKQDTLVSGTNIKTINSTSLLGSGDISITPNATHTGDVTGETVLTIANGAVTLPKMADMATASLIYRKTAGAGVPEVNTLATLKTDLGLTSTNSGDVTLSGAPNYLTIIGQVITRALVNLASHVTGVLPVANGGTGQTTYTNGQLLIGNTTGNTLTKTTLTAGAGISITNGTGSITITALGGGGISLSDVYPVGSIYTNAAVSTNPATLLGFGTWTAFGSGRVLVGVDTGQTEFDTLGETGGSKTHTLTSGEMPSHTHTQDAHAHGPADGMTSFWQANSGSSAQIAASPAVFPANNSVATTGLTTATNQNTGGGESHNNLQPYITVYMWRRTA